MKIVRKTKILIFSNYFSPAFRAGGPVHSVFNLVNALKDDFNVSIVTSNHDLGVSAVLDNIESNKWIEKDGYSVIYFSKKNKSYNNYKKLIEDLRPDIVHLNSMYSYRFSMIPIRVLRGIEYKGKIILSPRGMLLRGAIQKKRIKKITFLLLAQISGFYNSFVWHATSTDEVKSIRKYFGIKIKVFCVSNIPNLFFEDIDRVKDAGVLKLIHYSRISKEKNLLQGLYILNDIKIVGDVYLKIYGPIEEVNYWKKCQRIISQINVEKKNIHIEYSGMILPEKLLDILKKDQVLYNTTSSENFGHGIVECMSSGLPVILSNRTPWRELERENVGFDLSLDDELEWQRAIQFFIDMDQNTYDKWSNSTKKYINKEIDYQEIVKSYKMNFQINSSK